MRKSHSIEEVYQLIKEKYSQYNDDTIVIKKLVGKPAITFKELIFLYLINVTHKNVSKYVNRHHTNVSIAFTRILKCSQRIRSPFFWLLGLVGLDKCYKCNKIYANDFFDIKNHTCRYCKNSYDKKYYLTHQEKIKVYKANQRANRIKRTPKWVNLEKIQEIYKKCPEGYHVDHIIPLQGKLVSGLHVENNLQYLLAKENLQKNNKYTPKIMVKGIDY